MDMDDEPPIEVDSLNGDEKETIEEEPLPPKVCKNYKVLVSNAGLPRDALELLHASCEVHFLPVLNDNRLLVRYTQGMDGLLIDDPEIPIDREFLRAAGLGLKVISIVGYVGNQVNMTEATKKKIKVGVCSSDLAVSSSAEVAIGLALALCRRVKEGNNSLTRGIANVWNPEWLLGQDLKNCVCGIIGLGKLGTSISMRLQGFRPARIVYYSRRVKKSGNKMGIERILLDDLLDVSDIIFLCIPCTSISRGMFNEELFIKMKRCSILINTSHGGLVKINDLYCALRKGVIFGAGMDTEMIDAPVKKHPILRLDNFILLPSVSRSSALVKQRMYMKAVENLISGLINKQMILTWDPNAEEEIVETEEERLVRIQFGEEQSRYNIELFQLERKEKWGFEEEEEGTENEDFGNEELSTYTDWA